MTDSKFRHLSIPLQKLWGTKKEDAVDVGWVNPKALSTSRVLSPCYHLSPTFLLDFLTSSLFFLWLTPSYISNLPSEFTYILTPVTFFQISLNEGKQVISYLLLFLYKVFIALTIESYCH